MKKLGFITIGQSPRDDIMTDILPILGSETEILQLGALDALSEEQLQEIAPGREDTVLVSSLRNGKSIEMAEEKIIPLLQDCIDELETKGASGIMLLCTGDFGNSLSSNVPLIYPNRILRGLLPSICTGKFLVLVPEETQKAEALCQWKALGMSAEVYSISPYDNTDKDFRQLGDSIKEAAGDCILMDCMGYSSNMKKIVSACSEKNVLLPRTLAAAVLKELI